MRHAYNLSTPKAEAGESNWAPGHLGIMENLATRKIKFKKNDNTYNDTTNNKSGEKNNIKTLFKRIPLCPISQ